MRKQLDQRIPILIDNNVKKNHRSFIVLVGDNGRDQIVNLHFLLSQARVSARPSVLWCYKKELGFSRCVVQFLLSSLTSGRLLLGVFFPSRSSAHIRYK